MRSDDEVAINAKLVAWAQKRTDAAQRAGERAAKEAKPRLSNPYKTYRLHNSWNVGFDKVKGYRNLT